MGTEIMTDESTLRRIVKPIVEEAIEPMARRVRSLDRAIRGTEHEGNSGLIARVRVLERRQNVLIFSLPIWVTIGTGLGQVLISWWGL